MRLRMLSISDIHLFHKLVPIDYLINNLMNSLPDIPEMSHVDIIWLCGDIFDNISSFSDEQVLKAQCWIVYLLQLCKKHDIVLRVLEGTPSHDRAQSLHFEHLNKITGIYADVKYFDKLNIEYIERFNIHVLYIPDEYRGTPKETENEVRELLLSSDLTQVDYAIMHGAFEYQLPKISHCSFHNEKFYLSIVKRYIFIGHIHVMSRYDRILAQGSHDRVRHGEETSKGFFDITVEDDPALDRIIFKENKTAAIFHTVNFLDRPRDEIEDELQEYIGYYYKKHIPVNLRIIHKRDCELVSLAYSYKRKFPEIRWTIESVKVNTSKEKVTINIFKPTPITSNTISGIMQLRMERIQLPEYIIDKSLSILHELKTAMEKG